MEIFNKNHPKQEQNEKKKQQLPKAIAKGELEIFGILFHETNQPAIIITKLSYQKNK